MMQDLTQHYDLETLRDRVNTLERILAKVPTALFDEGHPSVVGILRNNRYEYEAQSVEKLLEEVKEILLGGE